MFLIFSLAILILTVVHSRFFSFVYHINSLVVPILPVDHPRPLLVCAISLLILFNENKWYAKSVACHQSKLVKDKHNVILILVSSSKFYSLVRRFIKILDFSCFIFSFLEFQVFLHYIIAKLHLNHRKASTLFFSSFFSCDHSFVAGVLHGGST